MATAAQIKSAVSRRGRAQRDITKQLAGVTEQLQKAEEASLIAQSKEKQSDSFLSGLDSLVGIGYTVSELIGQKRDIDEGIEYFNHPDLAISGVIVHGGQTTPEAVVGGSGDTTNAGGGIVVLCARNISGYGTVYATGESTTGGGAIFIVSQDIP